MLQIYRPSAPISWDWLALKGPDAADFLHRLTTVHIKALQPGQGSAGFLLTAQGKMRAYFHLWMISREEFFFEFDAGATGAWKQEFLTAIDQFHFGEKFVLESAPAQRPDLASAWLLFDGAAPAALSTLQPKHLSQGPDGISFFHHGTADFGKNWISVWGGGTELEKWLGTLGASANEITFNEVEALRISANRPRIDTELSENTIPLEVGLRDAVSDNKGCYPGQEVIERIISLGSPARRLSRLDGSGEAPAPGEAVKSSDGAQEVGQVTSVTKTEGGFRALAFIKKIHAKENLEVSFAAHPTSRARIAVIAPYA